MTLYRFFAYSFVFHLLLITAFMLYVPEVSEKKSGDEFFTRLVSPEELRSGQPPSPPSPPAREVPRRQPQKARPPAKSKPRQPTEAGSEAKIIVPAAPFAEQHTGKSKPSSSTEASHGSEAAPPVASRPPETRRTTPTLREKLFDKNVITELAKRHIEDEEKQKKEKTFTFDATEYRFFIYNRKLKERIESIWKYPPEAASKGIYGDLIIEFTILKNGRLGNVEIVRTSGHKDLDDAAIKALRDAAPFWPLPKEWGMERYTIAGHFIYTIYGYYVR